MNSDLEKKFIAASQEKLQAAIPDSLLVSVRAEPHRVGDMSTLIAEFSKKESGWFVFATFINDHRIDLLIAYFNEVKPCEWEYMTWLEFSKNK